MKPFSPQYNFRAIITSFNGTSILDPLFVNKIHMLCHKNLTRNRENYIVMIECVPVCGSVGTDDLLMAIQVVLEL